MGYELYREVKVWAPPSLTHREKLTAMVLADDANDRTRLTYSSVLAPEIMRQAMVPDDRSMRRIIAKLKEEKVLEHAGGGHNGRAAKYRFLHLAPAGSGVAMPGENDPATAGVGGSESPAYEDAPDGKAGENDPPTDGVGGSFSASRRVKKTRPTPSPPTTSSSTTTAGKPASGQQQAEPDLFDAFWSAYPRQVAKPKARQAWAKAIKHGADPADVVAAVTAHATAWRDASTETRFIPHPATWLNGERYNDEPDPPAGKGRPYQNPDDQDDYDGDLIEGRNTQDDYDEDPI